MVDEGLETGLWYRRWEGWDRGSKGGGGVEGEGGRDECGHDE